MDISILGKRNLFFFQLTHLDAQHIAQIYSLQSDLNNVLAIQNCGLESSRKEMHV